MSINWKLRIKNKTIFLSVLTCFATFVYQICGIFGVVVPISEDTTTQIIGLLINVLLGLGVLTDPTTKGMSDSKQALQYKDLR